MTVALLLGLFLASNFFASWSAWRRGYRHGYRLGRAQASIEEADREIAWHKRLAHPSRWALNKSGEALDLGAVKDRAR